MYTILRFQERVYLTTEREIGELEKIADAFGRKKKYGRNNQLLAFGDNSCYVDKELCGFLEERLLDRRAFALMDNDKLDEWLNADEETRTHMAENLFQKKSTPKWRIFNVACIFVTVGLFLFVLICS